MAFGFMAKMVCWKRKVESPIEVSVSSDAARSQVSDVNCNKSANVPENNEARIKQEAKLHAAANTWVEISEIFDRFCVVLQIHGRRRQE